MNAARTSGLILVLSLLGFVLDRLLKYLALGGYTLGPVDGGMRFELFPNPSIAFSIVFPPRLSLILIPIVLAGFIAVALKDFRRGSWIRSSTIALVVFPAVSNYIDRLRFGYVVDYLSVGNWLPVFNVSDVVIVCGLVLFGLMGERKRQHQQSKEEGAGVKKWT